MAQATMYAGYVNSPTTTLSSGITDSDTTIPVTELGVFPAAPNVAVIGTGVLAETIYYGAKSAATGAGNLTSVTREWNKTGTYGAKKSWLSGEIIGRNSTAYDHDTFKANIEDLDSAKAPKASPTFTGTATTPILKVTTGAAAGNLLVSGADGTMGMLAAGATTKLLVGGGAADPVWTEATGSGAPVRAVSPALTSVPTAPTAAADTDTTQIATTQFVLTQASDVVPLANGVAAAGTSERYSRYNHVHPTIIAGGSASTLTLSKDNNGVERSFFKDDFSNDTIANYTLSGSAASIAAGILSVPATGVAYHTITAGTTGKWDGIVEFTAAGAGTAKLLLGDAGTSYVIVTRIVTTNQIWLQLYIGGVSKIANTDTGVTLADNVFAKVSAVYDGTSWQMSWAGVNVGANTAAITVTTPIIGVAAGTIASAWDELTFIPSVAFQDLFAADTETRYMCLSSTDLSAWAYDVDDQTVDTANGKFVLTAADKRGIYVIGRSYNYASGEIEISFDCNNDGGGGADATGAVFCYQDILNHYKLVLEDSDGAGTAETLKLYKVVAGTPTQLGSTATITTRYAKGTRCYAKIQFSRETGQMWVYFKDNTGASSGLYPTTPDIADAFPSQFSYGKAGYFATVTTAAAGNLNVDFYPMTVRANLLIGETNVPTSETGFYFRDEATADATGRYSQFLQTGVTFTQSSSTYAFTKTGAGDGGYAYLKTMMQYPTIECDVKLDAGSFAFVYLDGSPTDSTQPYFSYTYIVQINQAGGTLRVGKFAAAGTWDGYTQATGITVTAGTTYHVKVVQDATTVKLYWDNAGTPTITYTSSTYDHGYVCMGSLPTTVVSFDNLTISGTRYYMKPMLRGAQIGEYYANSATVQATRFTDDFNWDTSAGYPSVYGTWTVDTVNGKITSATIASGIALRKVNIGTITDGTITYYASTAPSGTPSLGLLLYWDGVTTGSALSAGAPTNCYLLGVDSAIAPTGNIRMYRLDGNTLTEIATSGTITVPRDEMQKITVVHVGTTVNLYHNNVLKFTKTDATYTSGGVFLFANRVGDSFGGIEINALDSTSTNGISASLGGVPHGARYDTQEEAYTTFVNAATNGEYLVQSRAKSTAPATADFEYNFLNYTDTTAINWEGQTTATLTAGTTYVDGVARSLLRYQDVADTIRFGVRRKNYSGVTYDNQPAVFVDHVDYVPVWEV